MSKVWVSFTYGPGRYESIFHGVFSTKELAVEDILNEIFEGDANHAKMVDEGEVVTFANHTVSAFSVGLDESQYIEI